MTFRVACVGEQPPEWTAEQARAAGVEFIVLEGIDVRKRLTKIDPHGYVINSFGAHDEGPRVTAEILDLAPALQIVTYMGASREIADYLSYIDPYALRQRQITFTSTATREGNYAVAEAAVALLHALELNLVHTHRTRGHPGTRTGLRGTTLGIIGMGQIGHLVADLVAPLGMSLIYHSRSQHRDVEDTYGARRLELPELFAQADHLSVHLANSAPPGIIGAGVLARASGVTIINTASAPGLIEPAALIQALHDGRVRRVAIEGTYPQPYDDQLREMGADKAVLLPAYTSWDTSRARTIGWQNVLDTYIAAANHQPIPHKLV